LLTIVESVSELVKVKRQILSGNFMKDTGNGPLEERPDIFDPIGMDIPGLHVGFLMIYGIVDKFRGIKPQVRRILIGMDFGPRLCMIADEVRKGAGLHIFNRLHKDFA